MKTRLTELLGCQYPIIQGGMAFGSSGKLAAAVSAAGGVGIIGIGPSTQWSREQVRLAKSLTDKPFGMNIPLVWANAQEMLQVALEEKPALVSLGAGKPTPELLEAFHAAGIKVFSVVPGLKAAKGCAALGVDGIVVEGTEAGGIIGSLTTLTLMTEVIPEIDIPVVAAGGFVDGRGLAAALVMGAAGVQIGTRFLASEECEISQAAKDKLVASASGDVVVIGKPGSKSIPTRGIRSAYSDKMLQLAAEGKTPDGLQDNAGKLALVDGDMENGFVPAGQDITPIRSILPAAEIVQGIANEAKAILDKAPSLLGG
ncbi:MAG: enoyl-[acyl-carrier-protein] reductase FabK [Ruminococcaceae bacterium]|nr:enoyl-[acyl-carrier-protein] reductase FabK [Oscillospiraceae bacterium]